MSLCLFLLWLLIRRLLMLWVGGGSLLGLLWVMPLMWFRGCFLLLVGGLPRADVILTNPPFTRWMYLDRRYRERLLRVVEGLGYGRYVTRREVSLQTLSMFLCDYVLRNGGFWLLFFLLQRFIRYMVGGLRSCLSVGMVFLLWFCLWLLAVLFGFML